MSEHGSAETAPHPPIRTYFVVWGLLFVLSLFSYLTDVFHVPALAKHILVTAFALLKAGLILAVFMHLRFERLSLVYTILVPPLLLVALAYFVTAESSYVSWLRDVFFAATGS